MEIPIPKSPLKATNSYVIKGNERNLLIDTGQNCPEALASIRSGLSELAVDMERTDIFLTHMHADYWGVTPYIRAASSLLYASRTDAEIINTHLVAASPLDFLYVAACLNGFLPQEAEKAISRHPGNDPGEKTPWPFQFV